MLSCTFSTGSSSASLIGTRPSETLRLPAGIVTRPLSVSKSTPLVAVLNPLIAYLMVSGTDVSPLMREKMSTPLPVVSLCDSDASG